MRSKPQAVLSIDLEFWYSGLLSVYIKDKKKEIRDYIQESVKPILDLLKKNRARATFFVLSEVAEKYPELIKEIFQAGHEIASHGCSHKKLTDLSEKEFEEEIIHSKKILKEIIGKNPVGFRAPYFSLNDKTKWALKVLERQGFKYDSSIFPMKTPLYGVSCAPMEPYKISKKILEIPVAIFKFGPTKIPMAGGIYFRFLPNCMFLLFVKLVSKKRIPVLFFHPYDLYDIGSKIKSDSWIKNKLRLFGTKKSFKNFEKLFKKFNFISIEEYLK